jgi:hypothetical protein
MKNFMIAGSVGLVLAGVCLAWWFQPANGGKGWVHGYSIGFISIATPQTSNNIATALAKAGFTPDASRDFSQALPTEEQQKEMYRGMTLYTEESEITGFTFILGVPGNPDGIHYCETHSGPHNEVAKMHDQKARLIKSIETEIGKL